MSYIIFVRPAEQHASENCAASKFVCTLQFYNIHLKLQLELLLWSIRKTEESLNKFYRVYTQKV